MLRLLYSNCQFFLTVYMRIIVGFFKGHQSSRNGDVKVRWKVENQISDPFDVILGHYEWANKKLYSSLLKPDCTITITGCDDAKTEIFVIEVKTSLRNRRSNNFVKIGFIMKNMLDNLINKGVKNAIVTSRRLWRLLIRNGFDIWSSLWDGWSCTI